MVRNWVLPVLLVGVLTVSGCITSTNMTEGDAMDAEPPVPVLMSDTVTHTESVEGPAVHPQETVIGGPWEFTAPATLQDLSVALTWTNEQNAFRLRVTTPSGETLTRASSAKNASFAPDEAAPGDYTFEAIASGVVVKDSLSLRIAYSWLETPTTAEDAKDALISYVQEGNKWRATITYTTEDADAQDLTLDADTFNGPIEVTGTSGAAKATLKAYARADTKARAAELVQSVQITLGIEEDRLTARADDRSDRSGSESTGASIEIRVPGITSGTVDTSNGGITLDSLTTNGLSADTSNGPINGKLTASGDVTLKTSNGGIELHLVPTKSLAFNAKTSNGGIDLTLDESADIGYRLDAETSNGKISEDMDEAELSGQDDSEKRLETSGYTTRTVKVSGTVDTSNGHIRFEGA